ncbi:MAG: EamA family transporter, partial [Candidatus Marsarchaeota archaeon]|nr:EamA family transporter [Candidatus Marsarchaeota archaeon]
MHNELDAAARTREATANRYTSVAWLGPLALVWGYNWVVMKIGVEASEPFTFGALSMFLGGVLLVALLLLSRRPARPTPLGPILLVGLLQTSGFFGFAMWSLKNGAAGKTAVLAYAMPFWLILMAWPVLGERVRGLQWLAVVTALAGLVFILSPWHSSGSMASSALAIGSGLSWAAGVIAAKILQRYHRVELLSLTAWQMLLGSVPLIIVAFLSAGTGVKWSSPSLIGSLAYNVVLGAACGY